MSFSLQEARELAGRVPYEIPSVRAKVDGGEDQPYVYLWSASIFAGRVLIASWTVRSRSEWPVVRESIKAYLDLICDSPTVTEVVPFWESTHPSYMY